MWKSYILFNPICPTNISICDQYKISDKIFTFILYYIFEHIFIYIYSMINEN